MFINCIFPIFRSCTEECCKLEFLECSMTSSDSGLKLGGNETSGGDRGGGLFEPVSAVYLRCFMIINEHKTFKSVQWREAGGGVAPGASRAGR